MDLGLEARGVLITGGAGGIGTALTRTFAAEGAKVAVHYHSSAARAEALAKELGGVALAADLTAEAEVDALIPAAAKALGRLDVLIANAGVWPAPDEAVWEMSLERWRRTMAENLDSVFLCCRAFLRHVKTTGTGNIVIIASTAGLFGEAGHSDYAAAKGALASGFIKSLKNEIGRIAPGGRANVICPGWTAVERHKDKVADPAFVRKVTRTWALTRMGQPDDVARVAAMLASDVVSGHVTGEVVTVAGGMEGRVLRES